MKAKKSPSKEEEVGIEKSTPLDTIKPKKQKARVARILKKKEPQLVEGPKNALIIRGHKTSQTVKDAMSDIALLLKPYNKNFNRKKMKYYPFEDPNSLEFLCEKNDCSTFLLGTHSKKRPDNIVVGSKRTTVTYWICMSLVLQTFKMYRVFLAIRRRWAVSPCCSSRANSGSAISVWATPKPLRGLLPRTKERQISSGGY